MWVQILRAAPFLKLKEKIMSKILMAVNGNGALIDSKNKAISEVKDFFKYIIKNLENDFPDEGRNMSITLTIANLTTEEYADCLEKKKKFEKNPENAFFDMLKSFLEDIEKHDVFKEEKAPTIH
jgi:hypothetical protein